MFEKKSGTERYFHCLIRNSYYTNIIVFICYHTIHSKEYLENVIVIKTFEKLFEIKHVSATFERICSFKFSLRNLCVHIEEVIHIF